MPVFVKASRRAKAYTRSDRIKNLMRRTTAMKSKAVRKMITANPRIANVHPELRADFFTPRVKQLMKRYSRLERAYNFSTLRGR